jgi:hypothetical protein
VAAVLLEDFVKPYCCKNITGHAATLFSKATGRLKPFSISKNSMDKRDRTYCIMRPCSVQGAELIVLFLSPVVGCGLVCLALAYFVSNLGAILQVISIIVSYTFLRHHIEQYVLFA